MENNYNLQDVSSEYVFKVMKLIIVNGQNLPKEH